MQFEVGWRRALDWLILTFFSTEPAVHILLKIMKSAEISPSLPVAFFPPFVFLSEMRTRGSSCPYIRLSACVVLLQTPNIHKLYLSSQILVFSLHIQGWLDKRWIERCINYSLSPKGHQVNLSLSSNCSTSAFLFLLLFITVTQEQNDRLDWMDLFSRQVHHTHETFRISMRTWTLVRHIWDTLLIQSKRWLLPRTTSPVSIIRCYELHLSSQPADWSRNTF